MLLLQRSKDYLLSKNSNVSLIMNTKHLPPNICGNCKHGIQVFKNGNNTFDVKHSYNSYLCLETNCQCLDPQGRDVPFKGTRRPFNSIWNQDILKGVIPKW